MADITVLVCEEDFDSQQLNQRLHQDYYGAQVNFVGYVRDKQLADGSREQVQSLTLEHYPGMTEKVITQICQQAASQWPIGAVCVVHRVGRLLKSEQIVYVGVASEHRSDSFAACEFIMDLLKTQAPFWKKEEKNQQAYWVAAKVTDTEKALAWKTTKSD